MSEKNVFEKLKNVGKSKNIPNDQDLQYRNTLAGLLEQKANLLNVKELSIKTLDQMKTYTKSLYLIGQRISSTAAKDGKVAEKIPPALKAVENERVKLDGQMTSKFHDAIDKYVIQIEELEKRNSVLEKRKLEVERYAKEVKNSSSEKFAKLDQKLQLATESYQALREELYNDVTLLYSDSFDFVDQLMSLFLRLHSDLFHVGFTHLSPLKEQTASIDTSKLPQYKWLITPDGYSSAEQSSQELLKRSSRIIEVYKPGTSRLAQPIHVKAKCNFEPMFDVELKFEKGDVMLVTHQKGEWFYAKLNGKKGLIPISYVNQISADTSLQLALDPFK